MTRLFSDIFEVSDIDPHGKKFDRVSRLIASSENLVMQVTLDVNTEIYPISAGDKFTLVLASSLGESQVDPTRKQEYSQTKGPSLADEFEYVMYGKVYKYDDQGGSKVSVYVSFGGLLMCLAGDHRQLQAITVGQYLYLLMRK